MFHKIDSAWHVPLLLTLALQYIPRIIHMGSALISGLSFSSVQISILKIRLSSYRLTCIMGIAVLVKWRLCSSSSSKLYFKQSIQKMKSSRRTHGGGILIEKEASPCSGGGWRTTLALSNRSQKLWFRHCFSLYLQICSTYSSHPCVTPVHFYDTQVHPLKSLLIKCFLPQWQLYSLPHMLLHSTAMLWGKDGRYTSSLWFGI